ncbi:MAG: DeoR/GlpR transcriptional regulator [Opitutaceae bacterium]|nr:DeoR/GlpR transcriptional regulator [Opitutaceae bacterium]
MREHSTGTTNRHHAISRILAETDSVDLTEIATLFGVSPTTVRRDAASLVTNGDAVRKHGRLSPARRVIGEQSFRARMAIQKSAKEHIARFTAALIPHQGDVFIDAGTTCFEVGRLLAARPHLRIFTNSIPLLELAAEVDATLVCIGGEVRKVSQAMTGAFVQPRLARIRFHTAVVGASGIDPSYGAYTSEIREAAVKAEVLKRANERILVADAEKWLCAGAARFAPWTAFTALVTNRELSPEETRLLARANVAAHGACRY